MTTDGDKPDSVLPCRTPPDGRCAISEVECDSLPQELLADDDDNDVGSYGEEAIDSGFSFNSSSKKKRRRRQTASQRKAANMRERRRMRLLNQAFDKLKRHLPNTTDHNRLSRMQTLKAAIIYIEYLSSLT